MRNSLFRPTIAIFVTANNKTYYSEKVRTLSVLRVAMFRYISFCTSWLPVVCLAYVMSYCIRFQRINCANRIILITFYAALKNETGCRMTEKTSYY